MNTLHRETAIKVPMGTLQIHPNIIKVYLRSMELNQTPFDMEARPFVPIGMVGAVLVLAHFDAERAPSLPPHMAQRAVIERDQYDRILEETESIRSSADMVGDIVHDPLDRFGITAREMGKAFSHLSIAAENFRNHFVLTDGQQQGLASLEGRSINTERELPPGFPESLRFLRDASAVVDLRTFDSTEYGDIIPDEVTSRIPCICIGEMFGTEHKTYLVAVTADTPNSQLEDRLHQTVAANDPNVDFRFLFSEPVALESYRTRSGSGAAKRRVVSVRRKGAEVSGKIENVMVQDVDLTIAAGRYAKFDPSRPGSNAEDIVGWILEYAMEAEVSDIHLELAHGRGRCRFRSDGELKTVYECNRETIQSLVGVVKSLCGMQPNSFDQQDKGFAVRLGEEVTKLRVSAMPTYHGIQKIVMRLLPKTPPISSIYEMGLSSQELSTIKRTISRPQGLVVVSGPTGSGKTTTIYSMMNEINQPDINIQTVEDPVEYVIDGVNQTPTDEARSVTFKSLMRAILRQDPDVVFIGEMRDEESALFAVEASLTGHLVFSTLHSLSAAKIVQRLVEMGVPKELLSESLALLQAQRLLKRLSPSNRREVPVTDRQREIYDQYNVPLKRDHLWVPGVDEVGDPVYGGRTAIMELIPVDDQVSDLISRESSSRKLRQKADEIGYRTYFQNALAKAATGEVSFKDAMVFEG
jgi:type II secretory ATPase GspE/PulE/Tfp pilus assembly ATPase PilB-like protein